MIKPLTEVLLGVFLAISITPHWEQGNTSMSKTGKQQNGVSVTHFLTVKFEGGRGYDPEFHRHVWNDRCPICGRLFSEHNRDEFSKHWDEIFARSLPAEAITMEELQQRAMDERKELVERIYKLSAFCRSEMFQTLPSDEQERLQRQLEVMVQYHTILAERIANFPSDDKPKE